jgi:hypothetical protein
VLHWQRIDTALSDQDWHAHVLLLTWPATMHSPASTLQTQPAPWLWGLHHTAADKLSVTVPHPSGPLSTALLTPSLCSSVLLKPSLCPTACTQPVPLCPAYTTSCVRWTDWVPTLGGRSVRPILDRMDWALTQLLEGYDVSGVGTCTTPCTLQLLCQHTCAHCLPGCSLRLLAGLVLAFASYHLQTAPCL